MPNDMRDVSVLNMKQEPIFWPSEILPRFISPAQILTWGYESAPEEIRLSTSHTSERRHGEALLFDLASFRSSANVSV